MLILYTRNFGKKKITFIFVIALEDQIQNFNKLIFILNLQKRIIFLIRFNIRGDSILIDGVG